MDELIPISTHLAAAARDSSAKKGRKLERGEKALQDRAIMLTPLVALILVYLFSAVGSALAGS